MGVAIGIAGVIAIFGLDLSGSGVLGGLAVVLASLGYAVGGFILKARFADAPAIGVVAGVMSASALLLAAARARDPPSDRRPRSGRSPRWPRSAWSARVSRSSSSTR